MAQSPVDQWNLFQKDRNKVIFKPDSDGINVSFEVKGKNARILMNEASRRGISYDEMAAILLEQGLYFWVPKT